MKRAVKLGFVVALVAVAFLPAPHLGAQEAALEETFDDPALPGWEHTPGASVVDGALRIEPGDFAFHGGEWGDLTLTARIRPLGDEGAIVISYRAGGGGAYFVVVGMGFVECQREVQGQLVKLGTATVEPIPVGEWSEVSVSVMNTDHAIELLGTQVLAVSDPDPLPPGGVAFETVGEAAWDVDDVRVVWAGGPRPSGPPEPVAGLTWVRTGGPLGGLGYDVRMRPDNLDAMYVTDAWAGVFVSTDGGEAWFPSNEGITTRTGESGDAIPVFCLTIDPHDHDIIWVGTQNVRGIFKSTDGGRTWVEKDDGVVEYEGITFRGITVDPRSSDIVYAAGEISSWAGGGEPQSGREFDKTRGVVYKTTDGGENWAAAWRGDNLARYVWIDPRDPDVLYVSTGIFDREAANSDHTTDTPGGEGVLKSTDGGQTWQRVNDGITNLYVGTLFMHPEDPDVLLAGTGNNAYWPGGGVFLTTDGGTSWEVVLTEENINAVEFAVADPSIAYAGSAGAIYRSEDGGRTWERLSGEEGWGPPGVRAGFPIDFQVDPGDPNRVFANNYGGGNFLSVDGGRTWAVASKGYTGAQVRDIAVDPISPGRVFAAARSGIFLSSDGGGEWVGLGNPPAFVLEWNAVVVDSSDVQHVLAASNWDGLLLQSRDGGQTWQRVGEPLGEGKGWRAIAFAPSDPATVYGGTSAFFSAGVFDDRMSAAGVYVSHDGGANWEPANGGPCADANVAGLAVDFGDARVVYAATTNHGVLKSTDGGQSWLALNQGLPPSPAALAVTTHPSEPQVVFAGLERAGPYRSTDGGETWQPVGAGLNPESRVTDVVLDPTDPQVAFLADSFSGVYRSTDGGSSWTQINNGLRTRAVNELALSADGQHLYAATEGEGVFRLDLGGEPPPEAPPVVAPGQTPVPTATTGQTPTPTRPTGEGATAQPGQGGAGGGGICGGAAVLPLALMGLIWRQRKTRGWKGDES